MHMLNRTLTTCLKTLVLLAIGLVVLLTTPLDAQQRGATAYRGPRAAGGHPDLNGIWQAMGTAHWNLEDHSPSPSPMFQMGALGAMPGGQGVVEGGSIPYRPAALAKRRQNFDNRLALDPEVKCYMPGIPRATYMPYPFQILQSTNMVLMAYEYASSDRIIHMTNSVEAAVDTWMGTSNGRWEGETLVVVNTGFNDLTWFDRSGNFHSDQLKVTERFTLTDATHMQYEATIEDPQTFTRPWKISMPLYKRVDKNAQLVDFKCVEYAEELLYGDLRKKTAK